MTIDDNKLREFFREERRRDERGAPPFRELVNSAPARARPADAPADTSASRGPEAAQVPGAQELHGGKATVRRVPRWWIGAAAAVAAAWAGLLLVPNFTGTDSPEPNAVALATDIDAACDAALAALDELESEARMEGATDALLRSFEIESD